MPVPAGRCHRGLLAPAAAFLCGGEPEGGPQVPSQWGGGGEAPEKKSRGDRATSGPEGGISPQGPQAEIQRGTGGGASGGKSRGDGATSGPAGGISPRRLQGQFPVGEQGQSPQMPRWTGSKACPTLTPAGDRGSPRHSPRAGSPPRSDRTPARQGCGHREANRPLDKYYDFRYNARRS